MPFTYFISIVAIAVDTAIELRSKAVYIARSKICLPRRFPTKMHSSIVLPIQATKALFCIRMEAISWYLSFNAEVVGAWVFWYSGDMRA